jgi:hypothetical protein
LHNIIINSLAIRGFRGGEDKQLSFEQQGTL